MRNSTVADELTSIIERIERLEEEKRTLSADINDIKAAAKARGFDVKAIGQMLRERRMDAGTREEFAAMCELYRATLGMLHDTPLGEAARRRLSGETPPKSPDQEPAAGQPDEDQAPPETPPVSPPLSAADIEAARERGRREAQSGSKVTENPFAHDDPRRAAWDEGWCQESGSDGMDIPAAFRRRSEKPAAPAASAPSASPAPKAKKPSKRTARKAA
jgi:uncharacterized protein (UPF0335 family)